MSVIEFNIWIPWMSTRTRREENVWNPKGFHYACHSIAWSGDDGWLSWESSDTWLISFPLSSAWYLQAWRTLLETGRDSVGVRVVKSTGRFSQNSYLVRTMDKSCFPCWEPWRPTRAAHMRHNCHIKGRPKCVLGRNVRGMNPPYMSVRPNHFISSACLLHCTPMREEEFKKKEDRNLVEINYICIHCCMANSPHNWVDCRVRVK